MSYLEKLFFIFGGAFLGLAVGVIYFVKADRKTSVALRLATTAFAPSLAAIFVLVGFLWPEHYRFNAEGKSAYLWLQLVPGLLLLLTLVKYPGPKRIHFVLVPVALVAWAWTLALGWMHVSGK